MDFIHFFEGEKIVAPQRSQTNTFGYNTVPWFASADVYFISLNEFLHNISLKYILALLNSKLYYLWLYNKGKRKGESLELYHTPLSEIPIKKISLKEQEPFIQIVDQIISYKQSQKNTEQLEQEIDSMLYTLYKLSDEEIKLVDKYDTNKTTQRHP